jgi:hypothetical protein
MRPTPERGTHFRLVDRALDVGTGEAVFRFDLDGQGLEEQVQLPAGDTAVDQAMLDLLLDVAHVVIGTSYYKLSAPRRIEFTRPVPGEVLDLARQTYDEGLRELAVTNGLPVPLESEIVAETRPAPRRSDPVPGAGGRRPLVPIGGGKDSAAVLAMLPDATGVTVSATPAQRRLTDAAGVRLLEVGRTLDPELTALTEAGGYNGHIPITAINSALSMLVAALHGHAAVAFGNERSANEPTRLVGGVPVNHQHSKSYAYEEGFAHATAASGIAYFSLLRRLSGLSVAGIVAAEHRLRGSFLSCNRAFVRSRRPDDPQTWCLECPKCLSTFLSFAPFLDVAEAAEVFGGDPLADAALTSSFADLWDLDAKPFECVAELAESAVAMAWLADTDGWRDHAVVAALAGDADRTATKLDAAMDDLLRLSGPHLVPDDLDALVASRALAVRPRR